MLRSLPRALFAYVILIAAATPIHAQIALDLAGHPTDPFAPNQITVLVFIRSDCPISNRYAPEIQQLAQEFKGNASFWLVYPDRKETPATIQKHLNDYGYKLPALRDMNHDLVKRSHATITPEAAVFRGSELEYVGRIDDRAIDFGAFRPVAKDHDLEAAIQAVIKGQPASKPGGPAVGCYISDLE